MTAPAVEPETVFDVLQLVMEHPPELEVIDQWSPMELVIAYDWAIREHLSASDNPVQRRQRPWFITVYSRLVSA